MNDTLSKIEKRTAYTLLLPAVFLVFAIVLFPIDADVVVLYVRFGPGLDFCECCPNFSSISVYQASALACDSLQALFSWDRNRVTRCPLTHYSDKSCRERAAACRVIYRRPLTHPGRRLPKILLSLTFCAFGPSPSGCRLPLQVEKQIAYLAAVSNGPGILRIWERGWASAYNGLKNERLKFCEKRCPVKRQRDFVRMSR